MIEISDDACNRAWQVIDNAEINAGFSRVRLMRAALLAALGESHVVVPREPVAWLVGWHRANGEAGLTAYVNEDDARRSAKNLEVYSASETMADVQPLYAVPSPDGGRHDG